MGSYKASGAIKGTKGSIPPGGTGVPCPWLHGTCLPFHTFQGALPALDNLPLFKMTLPPSLISESKEVEISTAQEDSHGLPNP
jgi:hypothetical protein